jgi:tetratricopeptide (TPR) repeat protein
MRRSNFVMRLMAMLGVLSAAISFAADRVELDASPAPAARATAELLETGWKASSERYAQAQEIYQRARQAAPGDVRVPYAMSLVAMRNSKLDEAAKYIDEALPSEKTNFPIRRVEFWIDVQRKDKDAQKSDLRKLAEILVADKSAAERDSYQETAHWLGSVMGYYAFAETGRSLLPVTDRQSLDTYISGLLRIGREITSLCLAACYIERR